MNRIVAILFCVLLANSMLATGSVTLSFPVTPATSAVIYYGADTNSCTNRLEVGNTNSATVLGLNQGATYWFMANIVTPNGETPWLGFTSYQVPLCYWQPVWLLNQVTQTSTDFFKSWSAVATNIAVITTTATNQFFRDFLLVNRTNRMMFQ